MAGNESEPSVGETIVCKVKQVLDYGAFVELLEYGDTKGFVHVSQVASRWVKNIRNHVKEGQVRAAKVLSLNRSRNQIDLSFTKVSAHAQRARIEEWKQLKRCRKLLEVLAKEQGQKFDEAWESVEKPLLENYDSLYEAFQNISIFGEEAAEGVSQKWLKSLVEIVKKNVVVPEKTLKGVLSLKSLRSDGVDAIKKALSKAPGEVEIFYSGAGNYVLKAKAADFKAAEKLLNNAAELVSAELKSAGGEAKFKRLE